MLSITALASLPKATGGLPRSNPCSPWLQPLDIQAKFDPSDFGHPLGCAPLSLFSSALPSWPTSHSSPISSPQGGSSGFSPHSNLSSWLPEFWLLSLPLCPFNLSPTVPELLLSSRGVFAKASPTDRPTHPLPEAALEITTCRSSHLKGGTP